MPCILEREEDMRHLSIPFRGRQPIYIGIFAIVGVFILLLLTSVVGLASTVTINDPVNVLNAGQVQSEGSNLPDPITIYTTSTFTGTTAAFDQQTKTHITSPNLLVMAIDTVHKHVTIVGGSNIPLSNSQYNSATQAFVSAYRSNNGDYTAATIAAIRSLRSNLGAAPVSHGNSPSGTVPVSSPGGSLFSGLSGTLCCVGLLVLVVGGILFAVRRRAFGFRQRDVPIGNPISYNQPYNQGYPPNYAGPYNQGQGINPLAAGGLGAAAGGLIGYELGKEQGENQMREQEQYQQGGHWDGGNNNDFGGGSGADFGNNGGNGDFGGGSGADFGGGGGDFGGGGSSDFGGGGGGDFGGGGSANF